MKLAAAVILYHPDESVIQNISTYLNSVDRLYILDNSETSSEIIRPLVTNSKVEYIHDGENKGISFRLNTAAEQSIVEGFEWLLTMDQDSFFDADNINNYLECINEYDQKNTVAMFGVQYTNATYALACTATNINFLITSGSVVNLKLYKNIGEFDEALFIDEVDLEYCYRARSKGYKIVQFSNIYLQHQLGEKTSGISLKSFKSTIRTLHSPLRVYYMVRNYFYVKNKYPELYGLDKTQRSRALLNRIKNNLLYGNQKLLLLKMIIKGYQDFKKNRMGKYPSHIK